MTETGGAFEALFPVVYFDGERTVDMGCVAVNSAMTYKGFQLIISHKMCISPNQITIYFERTPSLLPSPSPFAGRRRRFPVTNKFDFSAAIAEWNCAYFLVVSKKSRRDRRRVRNRQQKFHNSNNSLQLQDDKFVLLRRNPNYAPQYIPPIFPAECIGFDMSQNLNSDVYSDLNGGGGKAWSSEMASDDEASSWGEVSSTGPGPGPGPGPICDVCEAAKMEGHTASFHWCKLDTVVRDVFRSTAGPIARPRPSSSSRLSG